MATTTLEEKINKIRQQNEEIKRRHEEVEADKQNAAKLNALVKMVPPTDWPERKEPPEFANPPPVRGNGNSRGKVSTREYRGQQQQYHAGGADGKKTHVFADGDGPPPDPSYNFLADSEREERTREDSRDNDRFRGRGGPTRGSAPRRRGGGREGNFKEYKGFMGGPKDATKPEYDAWRAERNRIDEARISRQRTAEGNWRREWDNNKLNVEEDDASVSKTSRLDIGDVTRKDHKEYNKWQVDGNGHDFPRGRGGKQYNNRGVSRGSYNNRVYQHSNSFDQFHGPISPSSIKPPLSPNGLVDRTVVATDKSIEVIVNHGSIAPRGPLMSVKVSSSNIAGTGRVGPRQKPRVLYSSQSETEASNHEHDKFSGHKSPDDKTNRVYFNQDIDEQQRYVSKSPHSQRKSESDSKSPYLPRKDLKYDAQQHRHGEIDSRSPKSPYLQRKEIKDYPKSPHFQRKDFTDRDSHLKQKNNISGTEPFKSTHFQKRTIEKTLPNSQKLPAEQKIDDTSMPKPQRTKKRHDKSKSIPPTISKQAQRSCNNENHTEADVLGSTSEKSLENQICISKQSNDEINDENDILHHSDSIEMVEKLQRGEDNMSKLTTDSESIIPSVSSKTIDESIPENNKLIDSSIVSDNVEPILGNCADANLSIECATAADDAIQVELDVQNMVTKNIPEPALQNSIESKPTDCGNNFENAETVINSKLQDVATTLQEAIKTETALNKITGDNDETNNIQVIADNEQNVIPTAADLDDSKKLEVEVIDVIGSSEFQQVEAQAEVTRNSEQIINDISHVQDIQSTCLDEQVAVSPDSEHPGNNEGKVTNDINDPFVNSEDKVNLDI